MNSILNSFLNQRSRDFTLSDRGFMNQGKEASGSRLNASIGIALNDDSNPAILKNLTEQLPDSPESVLYSSCYGEESLRRAWKSHQKSLNPSLNAVTYSTPVVCNGITHAMNLAGQLFFEPKDSLILSSPVYDNYLHSYEGFFQSKLLTFPLLDYNGSFNLKGFTELLEKDSEPVKLLLNFPNNPLGYSLSSHEAELLRNTLLSACQRQKKVLLILDDAYFGLFYEDETLKESLFSYLANLHENLLLVKLDGASKEFYSWGLRIGFISFHNPSFSKEDYIELENRSAALIRASVSNVSKLNQTMLLKVLENPSTLEQKKTLASLLESRYRYIKKLLAENPDYSEFFTPESFNSGYFFSLKLKKGIDANSLRVKLRKQSIGLIAPTDRHIRIAYSSLKTENMKELLLAIYHTCRSMIGA